MFCLQDLSKPLVLVDLGTAAGQQQAQQLLTGKTDDLQQGSMLLQLLTDGTLVLSNIHKVCTHSHALVLEVHEYFQHHVQMPSCCLWMSRR
jgi:hypothetical protein